MIIKLTAADLLQAVKEWAGKKAEIKKPMIARAEIHGVWTLIGAEDGVCISVEFTELPDNVRSITERKR